MIILKWDGRVGHTLPAATSQAMVTFFLQEVLEWYDTVMP